MLTFTINSLPLLLDESASVRITRTNPACFMDAVPGDIALGITIPVNDHNRAILKNPERFEKYSEATSREFPGFEARYSGVLLMAGTLIVQTATKESYGGWLRSELGNFGKEQREKNLTDLPWPTNKTADIKASYDDDVDDCNFPSIYNPGFWDGIGREESVDVTTLDENGKWVTSKETVSALKNSAFKNYGNYMNHQNTVPLLPLKDGAVITPFLHLRYVLKEAFRMNKWFIGRNDMLLATGLFGNFTKDAMVYNNFNIADITPVYRISATYWNNPYTNEPQEIYEQVIDYFGWEIKPFKYADLLPRVSMKDFLIGIQNSLNYIFFFKNDSSVDIIDRNGILSGAAIDIDAYKVGNFEPGEQKNTRLKFTPEFDKDDALYGSGFEDLSDRWADFKTPVELKADLEAIATPEFGELRLVITENKIYEWTWVVIDQANINRQEEQMDTVGWKFISTGPQPYVYGTQNEEEEIKTAVSSLQQMTGTFGAWRQQVNQRGNLASMRSQYSDFTLRLFSARFFEVSTFYWHGNTGLFERRWRTWANFWKTRLPVEAEFNFPLNALSFVGDNICSKFTTEKGAFIIEEMETSFGLNEIGVTQVKGYK